MMESNVLSKAPSRKSLMFQLFILGFIGLVLIIGSTFFNELIVSGNGTGWDGQHYANMGRDFFHVAPHENMKYVQRFLPSLIVFQTITLLHLSPTISTVIVVFSILNLLLILVSVFVWFRISLAYQLSTLGNWLGFGALFISFGMLKFSFYYPTLVDVSGFTLSMFLLLFYKKENTIGMFAVFVLGALTWPVLGYMAIPLLVFKKRPIEKIQMRPNQARWIAFLAGLFYVLLALFCVYKWGRGDSNGVETFLVKHGLILGLMASSSFIYLFIRPLINGIDFFNIKKIFQALDFRRGLLALLLFVLFGLVYRAIGKHFKTEDGFPAYMYFYNILVIGLRQPFVFVVAHIVWFGPVFILGIFRWKKMCELIAIEGWGFLILILEFLLFMLDSESRHFISYIPFVVILIVKAIDVNLTKDFVFVSLSLSFIFSKVWISINAFPTHDWRENYFINMGYYFNDPVYLMYLAIVVVTGGMFYRHFKRIHKKVVHEMD